MTTKPSLADALEAWRGRTLAVETGAQTFDALVARVRELEAELALADAREQDAYESVVENYRAYVEEQAARIEALEGQVDRVRELEAKADAYGAFLRAQLKDSINVNTIFERHIKQLKIQRDAALKDAAGARRKALEEACAACYAAKDGEEGQALLLLLERDA